MNEATYKDRKFTFEIPSPWDGCAIFNMITEYKLPFSLAKSNRKSMPPDQLQVFMQLCLKHCVEDIPGRPQVVDDDGEIGINDGDSPLMVFLTTSFLNFFTDFWIGNR